MSLLCVSKAGYVIRGVSLLVRPDGLINFTLTFDGNGEPLSAGSMHSPLGSGMGKNSIVIVHADPPLGDHIFPLVFADGFFNIEVRDFHYVGYAHKYVLCGHRRTNFGTYGFVAEIDDSFLSMRYTEYPEATTFYSIWAPPSLIVPTYWNYYVCGIKDNYGVIASVDNISMQITSLYKTTIPWEYHKIISKRDENNKQYFVASGRKPECDSIGFTVLDPVYSTSRNYIWEQSTEPDSHCVVSEDVLVAGKVILASSYQKRVTLNPAYIPLTTPTIRAYQFDFTVTDDTRFCVYDVGTMQYGFNNIRVSVAGFMEQGASREAWYGSVIGLPTTNVINNNNYLGTYDDRYHFKIRYNSGIPYTGGAFNGIIQVGAANGALFGTPLNPADECDHPYPSLHPNLEFPIWSLFTLHQPIFYEHPIHTFPRYDPDIYVYDDCDILKGKSAPEYSMPAPENETEIINFYNRLTVTDTPNGTNYQIYSVTGQLIQTGTTNPDISIAQLSKGMYILRLETGKAFKFVK